MGQYIAADDAAAPVATGGGGGAGVVDVTKITIGEALEAAELSAGDQPVEPSDAVAIEAAEASATGLNAAPPGGLAARARAAADANALAERDEDKTRLRDVLAVRTPRLTSREQLMQCHWRSLVFVGRDGEAGRGQGGGEGGRGAGGGRGGAQQARRDGAAGRGGGVRRRGRAAQPWARPVDLPSAALVACHCFCAAAGVCSYASGGGTEFNLLYLVHRLRSHARTQLE